jgi:hypothetical protein
VATTGTVVAASSIAGFVTSGGNNEETAQKGHQDEDWPFHDVQPEELRLGIPFFNPPADSIGASEAIARCLLLQSMHPIPPLPPEQAVKFTCRESSLQCRQTDLIARAGQKEKRTQKAAFRSPNTVAFVEPFLGRQISGGVRCEHGLLLRLIAHNDFRVRGRHAAWRGWAR